MKRALVLAVVLTFTGPVHATGLWLTAGSTGDDLAATLGWMHDRIGLMVTAADSAQDVTARTVPVQNRPATRKRMQASEELGLDILIKLLELGDHAFNISVGINLYDETTLNTTFRTGEVFRTNTTRESTAQGGLFYTYQPGNAGLILGIHSTVGAQAGLMYWF